MNWGSLMYGFIIIFSTVYYVFWGRFTYKPPSEEVKKVVVARDIFYAGSEGSEREVEQHHVVTGEKELEKQL
jgi:hypothetical protein